MAYELSYGERLKVGWLFVWRSLLLSLVIGFAVGIIWGIVAALAGIPESLIAM